MPRKSKSEADAKSLATFLGRTVEAKVDLPSVIDSGVYAGERGVVTGLGDWYDLRVNFGGQLRAVMLDEIKVLGDGDE